MRLEVRRELEIKLKESAGSPIQVRTDNGVAESMRPDGVELSQSGVFKEDRIKRGMA